MARPSNVYVVFDNTYLKASYIFVARYQADRHEKLLCEAEAKPKPTDVETPTLRLSKRDAVEETVGLAGRHIKNVAVPEAAGVSGHSSRLGPVNDREEILGHEVLVFLC
eukprot:TRINITY_DN6626_c0_g2_i5.p2 TRINITY_DN6626_c0_g2~~TRINITY_DN6626_c0_g2_i5.p2  ORF type:complete len:109 (-),score=1.72 TRINITY_DN6626_c0_g2_i5:466-792(-)